MQSEVVCVNFCGDGVLLARMEGQRRLRKIMVLYGAVYAVLVHERACAWRTTLQGNDLLILVDVWYLGCSKTAKKPVATACLSEAAS